MFRLILISILYLFIPLISFSQIFNDEICGYNDFNFSLKRPKNKNHVINDSVTFKNDSLNDKVLYRIPVKFWIYQRSNGKGGLTESDMKDHINYLNQYYSTNKTGVQFYLRPDYRYINKDRLYQLNYFSQAPFQTLKYHSKGCINVHVADKLKKNKTFSIDKNYSGTYNNISKSVIISKGISSSTLSHEIGHYLGLKHPHRLWKFKLFQEPVSRTKKVLIGNKKMCEKKGDGLCDTPAEPNLTKYTDDNCRYTGWNVTDKYGEIYKPATDNIMSYTKNRECRDNFTTGQNQIIRNTLSKNKNRKAWNANSEKYNFDSYEPDNSKETASEIFLNSPQIHTFHKIYASKRDNDFMDNTDWLYINIVDTALQNIIISVSKTENLSTDIKISIFNNSELIFESIISENSEPKAIELNNVKSSIYFIKIEQESIKEALTGYQIRVAR